jgi:hypothetical protein
VVTGEHTFLGWIASNLNSMPAFQPVLALLSQLRRGR